MRATPTVLFLDFDGVLHPVGANSGKRLSNLPLLAALLREEACSRVAVVISSTWRQIHSIQQLRGFFPADLQARVIGVTPVPEEYESEHERYEEIKAWLDRNGSYRSWAAIDDDSEGFPPRWHGHVVFTNPSQGVVPADIARLQALLAT